MLDAVLSIMDMVPFNASLGIENSLAAWPGICAAFRARDGLFVVQVGREHQFERLAHAIGHPEWLEDARFARREGWRDHQDDVIRPALESLGAAARRGSRRRACWPSRASSAGPCFDAADLARDPHVAAHEMVISVPRPDGEGDVHVAGNPIKLSHSRHARARALARARRAHRRGARGRSRPRDAEHARLRAEKVIA